MWPGRVTCTAHRADYIPSCHVCIRAYIYAATMPIARICVYCWMIKQHLIAVAIAEITNLNHYTIKKSRYASTIRIAQVNTRMKFIISRNRMDAPAK